MGFLSNFILIFWSPKVNKCLGLWTVWSCAQSCVFISSVPNWYCIHILPLYPFYLTICAVTSACNAVIPVNYCTHCLLCWHIYPFWSMRTINCVDHWSTCLRHCTAVIGYNNKTMVKYWMKRWCSILFWSKMLVKICC